MLSINNNPIPTICSIATIGYAYVVADLVHVGHLNHLEACKALCDKLIVGVLTDDAVLERKPQPTIPFHERLRMVRAFRCVDVAVSQGTYSPLPNILTIKPAILFESASHSQAAIDEAIQCLATYGGHVLTLPYYAGCSTTNIKDRIRNERRTAQT